MEVMSTSDAAYEWDLTVPGDDAELAGEFRRHGIQPGQRVHVAVVTNGANDGDGDGDGTGEALPTFFGSFDGPADLAERSSEILRAESLPQHRTRRVEVPTTTKPPASKASRTAAMTVVLPDVVIPTTSSTPRPDVVIPVTSFAWLSVK
jgi:hypothetical protein